MNIKSVNPFDLSLLQEYELYSDRKVYGLLDNSANAFASWKVTSFNERSRLFNNCANVLQERKADLAKIITLEMGKPLKDSIAEVEKCAAVCHFYAENGEGFLKYEQVEMPGVKAYAVFQPLGSILAVMPWNFPFWQVFRFAVPTLFAGNAGVLKHASNVPGCALEIERVFQDSGFPKGVFTTLLVSSEKIPAILGHAAIKAVSLTGSEKAGSEVASTAARNIKKSLLELGGSDPFIVLENADVVKAASSAVKSRMINNGQSCISAKRFIISEKVYDEFVHTYISEINKLKIGDPMKMETQVGPMARKDLRDDLLKKVNESVDKGARLILGGSEGKWGGAFMEPSILEKVHAGMPAYEEEMFGPVAAFIKVRSTKEAIFTANDSRYGLGASLWTEDFDEASKLALEIESGNVFINSIVASDPKLPFGGIKYSGYGRELGRYGIKEFVNIKTIHHQL